MTAEWIEGRDPGDERDETPEVAGGEREALDLAEITRRLGAADEVVSALCEGKQRWTMSIPADIERDPDIVIARALHDARRMLALLSARPAPEREPIVRAREPVPEGPFTDEDVATLGDAMEVLAEYLVPDDRIFTRLESLQDRVGRLRSRPEPVSEPEPEEAYDQWFRGLPGNEHLRGEPERAELVGWRRVIDATPPAHEKHEVWREDTGVFVATPCYGMHKPWWVPLTADLYAPGKVRFDMRRDDLWRPWLASPPSEPVPDADRCQATHTVPTIPDGKPWTVRCDRPVGHAGQHRSDEGGVIWGEPDSGAEPGRQSVMCPHCLHPMVPYASPPSERAGERELREALEEIAAHPTARHEGQHMCLYCNGDGHSPDEILHGEDCPIEIARRALAASPDSGDVQGAEALRPFVEFARMIHPDNDDADEIVVEKGMPVLNVGHFRALLAASPAPSGGETR